MIKAITYIVIGLFVIFGFLYMLVIDVNVDDITSSSYYSTSKKRSHINDYLIKNDFSLINFTKKITSSCLSDDKACKTLEIYKYVRSSFIIDNSTAYTSPNPYTAFNNREGTYLDMALLYSSLLLHSGISTYIKKDNNKFYNYACGISNGDMYNALINDLHSAPLANKELTLRQNQVWVFDLSRKDNSNLIIDVEFFSAEPVDIILFPNKQEMNAHLKGQYGRYNKDCSQFNTSDAKFTCQAPLTGILVVKSHADDNKFRCKIYKGGLLSGDIKSEKSRKGNNCIQIDINSKGTFQYPGIIY